MRALPKISPQFLYGTAWKEDLTEGCVRDALRAGFRAIDTANQRKHYYEEGTGLALDWAYANLGLKRGDLFLQTKFTYARAQDDRKPYDEKEPFATQVAQSFESSLQHLRTSYIDSYVLHGPHSGSSLTGSDLETWAAMESLQERGVARNLGISNVNLEQLKELCQKVRIKPVFVQNRCFANTFWDKEIRGFCKQNEILYQGFSLLTANRQYLGGDLQQPAGRNVPHLLFQEGTAPVGIHPKVQEILTATGKTMQQVIFRFAQQKGMVPLVGTRSAEHMKHDLEAENFDLSPGQLETLEKIAHL